MRLIGNTTKSLNFRDDKNVVILLGDNGLGKTTVLDALATAIAPFPMQFPGISDFQLSDMDVHINRYGRKANYLTVDAHLLEGNEILSSLRYRKGINNAPKSNFEQLKKLALQYKEHIIDGGTVELPIFAYYGTGRGQFEVPARKRGFAQSYERWDCYKSALAPATDFKRFFGWFDLMEDEERRMKEKQKDWNYRLPVLETVRKALASTVTSFENPRIETKPLRFVMDRIDEDGSKHELRIEQLSDGYKIIIAMVADLAARMAEANPSLPEPLEGNGIVLIDEVDLHLHPRWQRTILSKLHETFPNIQFIVSTHSPIIVVGASDIAQIVNLGVPEQLTSSDVSKESIGEILLSDLFGLQSLFSPEWESKIKERDGLLAKSNLTEEEQKKLECLNDSLSKLSFLPNPESIKANKLIQLLAEKLEIQE